MAGKSERDLQVLIPRDEAKGKKNSIGENAAH